MPQQALPAASHRSCSTLDGIDVALDSIWQFAGTAAIGVAVVASIFHRAFTWYVLERWGKSARGAVVGSVEKNDDGSIVYVVSYEFTFVSSSAGTPLVCEGKQTTRYGFRPKDVVAVRYWPRWPRLSRLVERAV